MTAREYLGQSVDQYLMRPRAVAGVEPYAVALQGATRRGDHDLRAIRDQHRRRRRRTQGAWKLISGSLRATVSIDAWR
jgi:hypothetical protein